MITTSKLKDYVTSGHDKRKLAQWLLNIYISKHVPLRLSDLADTATVASEIDAIEECINAGDYQDAINIAEEGAQTILEDEGFELFNSDKND